MADLLDYLDKLNRERAYLANYGKSFRKLRWLVPGLVKDLVKELEEKWVEVSKERERTLEVIWADPVLRQRMKDREAQAVAEAGRRLGQGEIMKALPGRPYEVSEGVRETAVRVVGLERVERSAQHALDEALFYYGSQAWQNDGIEIGKLTKLIEELTLERDRARLEHHRVLDGLNTRLRLDATRYREPVSMIQDNVLRNVRAELPQQIHGAATPLSRFLEQERPRTEPSREPMKVHGPVR